MVFNQLALSGNLWTYLANINEQAQQRLEVLIRQMKVAEGVTEKLKETNQMEWIRKRSNIQKKAEEIVNNELIT